MAKNPFDQFDAVPVSRMPEAPGELPAPPGPTAQEANADPNNPFNAPVAPSGKLSVDEFASQLYTRLNNGDRPEDILAWSKEVNHPIVPNEAWVANLAQRDAALAKGERGTYGRVNENTTGIQQPGVGDTIGGMGAMLRKAGNVPLFYFGDEAVSAGLALAQDGDYWDDYEKNWRRLNARDQTDEAIHPVESGIGEAIGMGLSMRFPGAIYDRGVQMLVPKTASRAANIAVRTGAGAVTGAAAGATAATGEGSVDSRFEYTDDGALLGGLIGAGFPLVADSLGRLARPIRERLFKNSGRAMGDRMNLTNEELAAAEAELKRQKDLGLEPSLLDVLPERARNVIGSAGAHDSAREVLQDVAGTRRVQLPERVQAQGDEVILPTDTGPAPVRSAEKTRDALDQFRVADMDARIEPIRRNAVPLSPQVIEILGTKQGRAAIADAVGMELDPVLRDELGNLGAALEQMEDIDPRMPAAIRDQIIGEIMKDAPFTVNASDKISRALFDRAGGPGAASGVLNSFGKTVRDAARADPGYAAAMEAAAAQHGAREAVELGEQILSPANTDEFVDSAAALGNESTARIPGTPQPNPPHNLNPTGVGADEALTAYQEGASYESITAALDKMPVEDVTAAVQRLESAAEPDWHTVNAFKDYVEQRTASAGVAAPSNRELAQVGAADAVRSQAAKGPAEAKGVAEQFYDSPGQRRRTDALVGVARGDELAERMRGEVERVYRASVQASREGPAREQGVQAVENAANALYNPTSPVPWVRETARFLHRIGMSEPDAQWIVTNATDPAKVGDMLKLLERHGMSRDKAVVYAQELRDSFVKYMVAQEGGS